MMQRLAHSSLWVLLLAGWVGQQLLPWLHEAQMRSGYAGVFCGVSSIGERLRFAATAPPELRAAIARRETARRNDAGAAGCSLCAAVHAPMAADGVPPPRSRIAATATRLLIPTPPLHARRLLSQRRARGPPRSF